MDQSALWKITMQIIQPCTIMPHLGEKPKQVPVNFLSPGPLSYLSAHNPSSVSAESATAELQNSPGRKFRDSQLNFQHQSVPEKTGPVQAKRANHHGETSQRPSIALYHSCPAQNTTAHSRRPESVNFSGVITTQHGCGYRDLLASVAASGADRQPPEQHCPALRQPPASGTSHAAAGFFPLQPSLLEHDAGTSSVSGRMTAHYMFLWTRWKPLPVSNQSHCHRIAAAFTFYAHSLLPLGYPLHP